MLKIFSSRRKVSSNPSSFSPEAVVTPTKISLTLLNLFSSLNASNNLVLRFLNPSSFKEMPKASDNLKTAFPISFFQSIPVFPLSVVCL